MSRKVDLAGAAAAARGLLRRVEWPNIPVNPLAIAEGLGIHVHKSHALDGAMSGCLLKEGDTWGILINAKCDGPERQRFTVAHELGHFEIGWHRKRLEESGVVHRSTSGYQGDLAIMEREANEFAAEILMPHSDFSPCLDAEPIGLDVLLRLSELFEVSLTAVAIRAALKSSQPFAIIVCSQQTSVVEFAFLSRRLGGTSKRIHKGMRPPKGSQTASLTGKTGRNIGTSRLNGTCMLSDWLGQTDGDRVMNEEAFVLGARGKVLTALSDPESWNGFCP